MTLCSSFRHTEALRHAKIERTGIEHSGSTGTSPKPLHAIDTPVEHFLFANKDAAEGTEIVALQQYSDFSL